MKYIAVYGSLKKGFYNHARFGLGEPLARGTIRGSMFLLHTYPHLFREGVKVPELDREHEVEVYEVDEEVYQSIKSMEIQSGYQEFLCRIEGYKVTVFYSRDDLNYNNNWLEEYSKETCPFAYAG